MPINIEKCRCCLKETSLAQLFIDELGWDRYSSNLSVSVDGQDYTLNGIAQKRGLAAFAHTGEIPDYPTRRKIEREITKTSYEHLIVFIDAHKTTQIWQWVKRETGKPTACREHTYHCSQPGDALIQRLQKVFFSLEEEPTIPQVAGRVRAAFDVERITKRFYDRFKDEHTVFLKFIKGIPDAELQRWYVSVMLNRLMFVYFIQKKGFLNGDTNYLGNKLTEYQAQNQDSFYGEFLCPLFFEGFAREPSRRSAAINERLGKVPYLNGGIFQRHRIEELYGRQIQITDQAFERLFEFFEQYQWHLDERPRRADNEINPDVLGYIFEKYINQKQMGAYYTKEDITGYISKSTIIPYLLETARQKCRIAFEGENTVWELLKMDPDRYIYESVGKGVTLPLPAEVAAGLNDAAQRSEWNKPAPAEYALPTEIWREVVARRKRYEEIRKRLANGDIHDINDLITCNLDIRQFAQDVIENSEGPELLRAFWQAIENITVLDPACGSGAFLFAALNILEQLYEACLERMEVFIDELERSNQRHRPEKFSDFRNILERAACHPSRRYFIFKSIIINNLYGVDIMEEAVEICKLRLFLKLIAQVDNAEQIEPLPDIDFNIRAGNTLVGYADYDAVKKAVTSYLAFDNTLARIAEKAQDVDRLFGLFRQQQTELGGEIAAGDKKVLCERLKALENELNIYLAKDYGVDVKNPALYARWLATHKPFHWFIEFYGIMKRGGFDVTIGNPPYVEYSDVRTHYTIGGYATESCGNLYAFVMERSLNLLVAKGWFGMIVPVSIGSTSRMSSLRQKIAMDTDRVFYSSFADRPSCLFIGVHQILSICVCRKINNMSASFMVMASGFHHWLKNERDFLFHRLSYFESSGSIIDNTWGKFSNSVENDILSKIRGNIKSIFFYFTSHGKLVEISGGTGGYWLRAFDERQRSNEYKSYYTMDTDTQLALCGIINSSTFYWFWRKYSDCRHLTKTDIAKFTFDSDKKGFGKLSEIAKKHLCLLKSTREIRSGKMTYEQYRSNRTKYQADEIDLALAEHYGFTNEELDFIINYDIKYRMGAAEDEADAEE